jgi:hypothetical protein
MVEKNLGKFHAEKIILFKNHNDECPIINDLLLKPVIG